MKKYPSLYGLQTLVELSKANAKREINGRWYPARPLGYPSFMQRLRCAWDVFRGYADAVVWPEDDEVIIGDTEEEQQ